MPQSRRRNRARRSFAGAIAHALYRFVYQTLRILMVVASAIGPAMPPPPPPPPPPIEMVDDQGEREKAR
jgi:hypothetical protein